VTDLTPATLAEWEREARTWLDPEADIGRDPMQAIDDMARRVLALVSNPLTVQAAETIDSLREQLAEARALVHCGAAEDQRTCSCRRCTQGLAIRMGHRAWAAEERAEKAESALATARREAQEARAETERIAELLDNANRRLNEYEPENVVCRCGHVCHFDHGDELVCVVTGCACRIRRALASPEAHDETRPDPSESER
jgi:hypothetical protein